MAEFMKGFDTAAGYRDLLRDLLGSHIDVAPRGIKTREIRDVVMTIPDPTDCLLTGIGRGLSIGLAALEALQLIGGFSDPKLTVAVAPHYAEFLDGDRFHGAYGPRTRFQVGLALERLRSDQNTRRANITFWSQEQDLALEGLHDYPCTMHANFASRPLANGKPALSMTTVMRSNDAWLGYPYDIFQFTALQRTMARFLGIDLGPYTHIVHSMHLYATNFDVASILLKQDLSDRMATLLEGGVYSAARHSWSDVQNRAYDIVYHPFDMVPVTTEEQWFIDTAKKSWGHLV